VLGIDKNFHTLGHWPKGTNTSFISFVPKVENPQKLGKYMPISLVGCIYKIISKILTKIEKNTG